MPHARVLYRTLCSLSSKGHVNLAVLLPIMANLSSLTCTCDKVIVYFMVWTGTGQNNSKLAVTGEIVVDMLVLLRSVHISEVLQLLPHPRHFIRPVSYLAQVHL